MNRPSEALLAVELLDALKACIVLAELGEVPARVTIARYKALIEKAERLP